MKVGVKVKIKAKVKVKIKVNVKVKVKIEKVMKIKVKEEKIVVREWTYVLKPLEVKVMIEVPRHSFSTEQDWCSTNSRTQQYKFW